MEYTFCQNKNTLFLQHLNHTNQINKYLPCCMCLCVHFIKKNHAKPKVRFRIKKSFSSQMFRKSRPRNRLLYYLFYLLFINSAVFLEVDFCVVDTVLYRVFLSMFGFFSYNFFSLTLFFCYRTLSSAINGLSFFSIFSLHKTNG